MSGHAMHEDDAVARALKADVLRMYRRERSWTGEAGFRRLVPGQAISAVIGHYAERVALDCHYGRRPGTADVMAMLAAMEYRAQMFRRLYATTVKPRGRWSDHEWFWVTGLRSSSWGKAPRD